MSGESERIAERLEAVEEDGETATPDSDEQGADLSIAEQLLRASEFERRVERLREQAIGETEKQLEACFERNVEIDLTPTGDGRLAGEIHIPQLEPELDGSLDSETEVRIGHLPISVGGLSSEPDMTPDDADAPDV